MPVAFPLAVEIEINSECNMACPYCPNVNSERAESGHMSETLFRKILQQLRDIQYRGRISYHFYNEPTLHPRLEEFVAWTREALPESFIDLFSNGVLLSADKIRNLLATGVNKFSITRHVKAEMATFDQAYAELSAQERGQIHIDGYQDLKLTNRGGALKIKIPNRQPPLALPCHIPSCAMVITVKGNVVPCFEDYFQKHVMGNVQDSSLWEIWNSQAYTDFRETLKRGQRKAFDVCRDCNNAWVIS